MTDYGIDLSHYNTVADWRAVRGNNITYTYVKLTEATDWTDQKAASHVAGARSVGVAVGGYHFAHAGNVQAQVDNFTGQLRRHGLLAAGSLAPMLDIEAADLRGTANAFARDFITRLRATAGIRRVLVYAGLDWWRTVLRPDEWADDEVRLWLARYNGDPGNTGWTHPRLALHQHTQTGHVPGIPGNVDRDITLGTWSLPALTLGDTPAPGPTPPAPGGTYVIAPGDTLSGIAVRFGTTVAALAALNGIADPNRIQARATLRLPTPGTPGPAPAPRRYQIRSGDTLSGIAVRFGTTITVLARLNGIANPNKIQAGAWLTLP
ncbi:GH25 family lysozyme [Actinokineospora inagensis]|uniref:GH25 family lysozyme n=1 Tax=Actinokineospora inagensis TaxID=103730 RepID=UPI0003FB083D|nr:GH25 family lysozyme [Actinokineospora inagensis]